MAKAKKGKKKKKEVEQDDFELEQEEQDPVATDPNEPVAKNDAYTGMLTISLVALLVGCVLLFLDFQRYDYGAKPPAVKKYQQQMNLPDQDPAPPNGQPQPPEQPPGVPPQQP